MSPWLAALYVQEEYRGRGYAKELISKVVDTVSELGFSKIYLRTETAGEYYLKHGWGKLEDVIDENGIETTVYEKSC